MTYDLLSASPNFLFLPSILSKNKIRTHYLFHDTLRIMVILGLALLICSTLLHSITSETLLCLCMAAIINRFIYVS